MELKRIEIRNFKSLKNCVIDLKDINIIVGPNASGKTNIIELFELIKLIYEKHERNPFLKWWGYDHIIWNRKEELNIKIKLFFDYYSFPIEFTTEFTGQGGKFKFIKESILINEVLTMYKEGNWLKIQYEEKFLLNSIDIFRKNENKFFDLDWKYLTFDNLINQEINLHLTNPNEVSIFNLGCGTQFYSVRNLSLGIANYESKIQNNRKKKSNILIEINPTITKENRNLPFAIDILGGFKRDFIDFLHFPLLKRLNFQEMKNPFRMSNEIRMKSDASNMGIILYNQFLKNNEIPSIILYLLEEIFPGTKLLFDITTDGRILIKTKENQTNYFPPSLSDGFFKLLALATIIELKPQLIIVDEIEDSLYAKIIELLIDIISDRKIPILFTTHSPYVVDIIDPANLIIIKKGEKGSKVMKFKSPEKIKMELNEMKITLSEKWLFGIDKTYLI